MATLREASMDVAPATGKCAYRSSGDKITVLSAAGGEAVGDVVVRTVALQAIGVVEGIHPDNRAAAVAGDELQVAVEGMFYMPKATGDDLGDGERVEWNATNDNVVANGTGAHETVGDYASGDTYALVRINKFPGARTP